MSDADLRAVPDGCWQMERRASPWYPSLRLLRQPAPGDWAGVFEILRGELRGLLA